MSDQPPEDALPPVALEPSTMPNRPLTADQVEPLIAKEIGLAMASPKGLCKCRMPYAECVCEDEEEDEMTDPEALTPEIARQLAQSGVAALKPGDVLAVRVPYPIRADEMRHLRSYGELLKAETGVKVAFIPGEEFSHVTLNVTVDLNGAGTEEIAKAIRREVAAQVRTARGDVAMLAR